MRCRHFRWGLGLDAREAGAGCHLVVTRVANEFDVFIGAEMSNECGLLCGFVFFHTREEKVLGGILN